jgi:hypothetical protein
MEKQIVYELNEEMLKEMLQSYIRDVKKEPVPELADLTLTFVVGDERTEDGTVFFSFKQTDLDDYLNPEKTFDEDDDNDDTIDTWNSDSKDDWDSAEVLPCGKDSCPADIECLNNSEEFAEAEAEAEDGSADGPVKNCITFNGKVLDALKGYPKCGECDEEIKNCPHCGASFETD